MTEQNPYQPPAANLTEGRKGSELDLAVTGIKSLPALSGLAWVKDAFALFKKSPLIWIILIVLWVGLSLAVQLIPIIGSVATSLLYAVFIAGFMLGCAALERGNKLEIGHLFAGFNNHIGSLIGLGAMYLVIIGAFAAIVALLFGTAGGWEASANPENIRVDQFFNSATMPAVIIGPLLMILMIMIGMMFWFAPALVSLGGVSVLQSLKMSFMGCLKNILPMFIFSLVMMVLAVIATIPILLGWFVLLPMGMATFYTAYRAIYTD